jgi:hypothetical protein
MTHNVLCEPDQQPNATLVYALLRQAGTVKNQLCLAYSKICHILICSLISRNRKQGGKICIKAFFLIIDYNIKPNWRSQIWGAQSSVFISLSLLRCDAMHIGKYWTTWRKTLLSSILVDPRRGALAIRSSSETLLNYLPIYTASYPRNLNFL